MEIKRPGGTEYIDPIKPVSESDLDPKRREQNPEIINNEQPIKPENNPK